MFLNTIQPAPGSKTAPKRLGRGIASGKGKTCGKGHKGQKARAGGYHKVGFEGGQMPLQRRMPKSGFRSRKALVSEEIRVSDLNKVTDNIVSLQTLLETGLIRNDTKFVKIIAYGSLERVVNVRGLSVSTGARKIIENAGGTVEG
ncbi:MAG: 50S ribosomal protein L15 [Gammaproteobacteria bacterium]|nr:50S ribosomal protein L15 [Gammaproteobacteria bacterium]